MVTLEGVDLRLRAFTGWVMRHYGNVRVTSGRRTFQQQSVLYANRTRSPYPVARPGRSAHERGRAVDLSGPLPVLRMLGRIWKGSFPGARWSSRDPVHFEVRF